jgi:Ca-activated chloride channel family protein
MKYLFLIAISLLTSVDPATVRKINAAKSEAETAFKNGDYKSAIQHYQYLVDSLGVKEDAVLLNLANAYYLAKDTANAFNTYQALTESPKTDINSKAHQQLGIMANQQGRAEEALKYFKQAIKAEPSNDDARYNYEMLKKKLEEQKKQEQQQQNKDKDKKDQPNKDQQNKEEQKKDQEEKDQQNKDEQNKDEQKKDQEQKEQQEKEQQEKQKQKDQQQKDAEKKDMPNLDRDKLEQMKISEEKARMILEAMKNQEKQYLQQQKRKATQSRDRNKPDW